LDESNFSDQNAAGEFELRRLQQTNQFRGDTRLAQSMREQEPSQQQEHRSFESSGGGYNLK